MSIPLPRGARPVTYEVIENGKRRVVNAAVIEEVSLCIHVNGQELAVYQCTPIDQEAMALGFLRAEGFIDGLEDVALVELTHGGTCVDIWLHKEIETPRRAIKTSGCGGGVTFDDLTAQRPAIASDIRISPAQLVALFDALSARLNLYPLTRGVHASALCAPDQVLLLAEDVGRHNTLDKLWGKAMQQGIETEGRILITSGRISFEMMGKAAKMGAPIVASRTSPTSRSVALARAWNITLIGYLRRKSFRVYTGIERIAQARPSASLTRTVSP
ncbi:MAG: formate dehydrogenase accessory sulfurtransferase FdhD [Chloroflexi bacterium]|nr:formate dehydrogenase accessory sulfurtransferase FdhD [Chloroflexota bacterium]